MFELSGFPRWETVASNVLSFFLNPDERHGMGTLMLDALLDALDGSPLLDAEGLSRTARFVSADARAPSGWQVETERSTEDRARIDLYLTNAELDLAIVIENKLDAALNNPFASYAAHATRQYGRVLSAVLAPVVRDLGAPDGATSRWTSASLRYDDIFDRVRATLPHLQHAEPRSVEILIQFMENTSMKGREVDAEADGRTIEGFWNELRGREESYVAFFRALNDVNEILTRRSQGIHDVVRPALEERGVLVDSFVTVGARKSWGMEEGRVAVTYLGFRLIRGLTIELIVGFIPSKRKYGLHVKAYGAGFTTSNPIPSFQWAEVSATLADTDEQIASAFMPWVDRLLDEHAEGASARQA